MELPGAFGTIVRTARLGYSCAKAGTEAKVANDATKLNKFLDYVDKLNTLVRPKDFVPDRGRDKDGKLLGTGGGNWEDRRDGARKLTGYEEQKATMDEFAREIGGKTQRHTRQSVLMRMLSHDAFHTGEISLVLGMHGLNEIDLWRPSPT